MVRDLSQGCMTAELIQPDELVSGLIAQVRAEGDRESWTACRLAPKSRVTFKSFKCLMFLQFCLIACLRLKIP